MKQPRKKTGIGVIALVGTGGKKSAAHAIAPKDKPRPQGKYALKWLAAAITPENCHREIDWVKPVGNEAW